MVPARSWKVQFGGKVLVTPPAAAAVAAAAAACLNSQFPCPSLSSDGRWRLGSGSRDAESNRSIGDSVSDGAAVAERTKEESWVLQSSVASDMGGCGSEEGREREREEAGSVWSGAMNVRLSCC
ncbi:hypothetical protein PG999_007275 [Apiospora kogelbergensis]|uniref:Secreted protein n=1 Tax=Apiospora kogelbergensis TaxID=1337665 RepID=A0AAW0QXY4_9PEZI